MPDFGNMSIVEIGNYISALLDSMPQNPVNVFCDAMSVLLADYSNRVN